MRLRRALASGAALVTLTGVLSSGPTAAASPSLSDAKKQAAALAAQVSQLTDQAEAASEDYDAAEEQLGSAVTTYLGVQDELAAAQANDAAGQASVNGQTAALYEAGGPAPFYAEALNGDGLADVADRLSLAGSVLASQRRLARTSASATRSLARLNAKLATMAAQRSRLQVTASRKRALVTDLLAQQSQLLASADANVVKVAAQLQQEAQQRAAAKFATELADARELALQSGQVLGAATAPTAAAGAALQAAYSRIGTPYVWGATGPGEFDCSGLTGWAYQQAGVTLPRTSREQWLVGHHVSLAELQPGDLLFWALDPNNPATIHHVAIYAGNGLMIAAPHSGATVSLQHVYLDGFIGATRPTG